MEDGQTAFTLRSSSTGRLDCFARAWEKGGAKKNGQSVEMGEELKQSDGEERGGVWVQGGDVTVFEGLVRQPSMFAQGPSGSGNKETAAQSGSFKPWTLPPNPSINKLGAQ